MKFTVENGCFSYPTGREVLKNIDFELHSGELAAILGPNGAGKTTMLCCMLGFLSWKSGKSALDGEDIRKWSRQKLWQKVAYVPQAKNAAHSMRVFDMVLLGRGSHFGMLSQPGKKVIEKAEEAMERLGITALRERSCDRISGGELQMVLIARALAAEPELLVLDEPESNLDFKNQLIILDILSELANEGMACLFNTHYPAHALRRAHKSLLLSKTGEHLFGATEEVITEENIAKYFGVEAVIGQFETKSRILPDVIPIRIIDDTAKTEKAEDMTKKTAVLAVIMQGNGQAEKLNAVLHEHASLVVGRFGMPLRETGEAIITLTLNGTAREIDMLQAKILRIPGAAAKAVYADEL